MVRPSAFGPVEIEVEAVEDSVGVVTSGNGEGVVTSAGDDAMLVAAMAEELGGS